MGIVLAPVSPIIALVYNSGRYTIEFLFIGERSWLAPSLVLKSVVLGVPMMLMYYPVRVIFLLVDSFSQKTYVTATRNSVVSNNFDRSPFHYAIWYKPGPQRILVNAKYTNSSNSVVKVNESIGEAAPEEAKLEMRESSEESEQHKEQKEKTSVDGMTGDNTTAGASNYGSFVIRTIKARFDTAVRDQSFPIVEYTIGYRSWTTSRPAKGGKEPFWSNEWAKFLLRHDKSLCDDEFDQPSSLLVSVSFQIQVFILQITYLNQYITVKDKQNDEILGRCRYNIEEWKENMRFEGKLHLDHDQGWIQVHISYDRHQKFEDLTENSLRHQPSSSNLRGWLERTELTQAIAEKVKRDSDIHRPKFFKATTKVKAKKQKVYLYRCCIFK